MPSRRHASRLTTAIPIVGLWLVVALCIGVPLVSAIVRVTQGLAHAAGRHAAGDAASLGAGAWSRLALTIGVAAVIGMLAAALGIGPAWLIARRRPTWAALLITPLLLPMYLAYAGWSLARAPGTMVASWLEHLASHGFTDAPVWAGRFLAVAGLALWAWPLAMIAMVPVLARIDQDVLDQTRLSASGCRALFMRLRMAAQALTAGAGLVGLVMLGSAVPLHLAQIETDAIRLWRLLDQTGSELRWTAWVGAWPTVGLAVGTGLWLAAKLSPQTRLSRPDRVGRMGTQDSSGRLIPWFPLSGLAAWSSAIWAVAVLCPLIMFGWSIRDPGSLGRFWRLQGAGLGDSAAVALAVGALGGAMAAAAAFGVMAGGVRGGLAARAVRAAIGPFLVAAILPGVLVGSATLDAWSRWGDGMGLGWVADSGTIVVLTHVCRFGAVAALAGVWVARTEPWELAAVRTLEGATGIVDWARTVPPSSWMTIAGAGLAMGLLSMHEIEAAVIVHPPGLENLSRHLLSLLHFSRDEDLSAAAVWIIALGLAPAVVAGVALARGVRGGSGAGFALVQPSGDFSEPAVGIEPDPRGHR